MCHEKFQVTVGVYIVIAYGIFIDQHTGPYCSQERDFDRVLIAFQDFKINTTGGKFFRTLVLSLNCPQTSCTSNQNCYLR